MLYYEFINVVFCAMGRAFGLQEKELGFLKSLTWWILLGLGFWSHTWVLWKKPNLMYFGVSWVFCYWN